jgi:hypothetical protein
MLSLIGFIALCYLFIKFFPHILEAVFKFSVIIIGIFVFYLLFGAVFLPFFAFFA